MCSKHVEAWNKLIVKQKFCSSSWLITEINILRCTVSKTSKYRSSFPLVHFMHGFSLFSWRKDLWSSFASDSGKRQNTWNASKYLRTLSYNSCVFLHEILQKRENAETWNQKMDAKDSELVARNLRWEFMQNKQLINRQMTLMIHCKHMTKGWSGRTLHHTASPTNKSSTETQPAKTSTTLEWTVQNCQLRQAERESMVSQVDLETKYQSMDWERKSSPMSDKYPLQNPGQYNVDHFFINIV